MESNFPNSIDNRMYYSDLSNMKREIYIQYLNLLQNKQYSNASNYLNDNSALHNENDGIWYLGAEILNYLCDQINNIDEYMIGIIPINPIKTTVSGEFPTGIQTGDHWINPDEQVIEVRNVAGASDYYLGNETGLVE